MSKSYDNTETEERNTETYTVKKTLNLTYVPSVHAWKYMDNLSANRKSRLCEPLSLSVLVAKYTSSETMCPMCLCGEKTKVQRKKLVHLSAFLSSQQGKYHPKS